MMTQSSGGLGTIVAFLTSNIHRLEFFLQMCGAELRTALRASAKNITPQELEDAISLDSRWRQLQDGVQRFRNARLAVEAKRRACADGAAAMSRALTARQIDIAQMNLEVRGA